MSNTTIQVDGETTKAELDEIKDAEGHSSMDSTVKALIRDHERATDLEEKVSRLEAQTQFPFDDATIEAYQKLNLDKATPVPEPLGTAIYGGHTAKEETIPRLFRLFIKGHWIYNGQLARDPEYVDVLLTDGGFLFRYVGGFLGGGIGAMEDIYFFVARADYEDELLGMLTGETEFLAPPGGLRTTTKTWTDEYECVNAEYGGADWWQVLGGYGREVTDAELNALLDLRTVDEAIREEGELAYKQEQIKDREFERKNAAREAADEPLKVRSGLHIDTPKATLANFWGQFATRRVDWSPYDDLELDDLLPADPIDDETEAEA